MLRGYQPTVRRAGQPLTIMAAEAISGKSGFNVEGYRNYFGHTVVGAWAWSSRFQLGFAVEVDRWDAFKPTFRLKSIFWALNGLIVITILCIALVLLFRGR